MNNPDNYVNPDYNEGAPDSSGSIVSSYVAEEKDTLPDIAKKFGLSIEELLEANKENKGITSDKLESGTRLLIPNKKH
jgi:LysM repeat protein